MDLVLYEDHLYRNFLPLAYLRPVFDLRCGILSFRERASELYPDAPLHLFLREYLSGVQKDGSKSNDPQSLKEGALFLNGRALLSERLLPLEGEDRIYLCGDEVVAFRLGGRVRELGLEPPLQSDALERLRAELPKEQVEVQMVRYPWDLVNLNSSAIAGDFKLLGEKRGGGDIHDMAVIRGEEKDLHIGRGSKIEPFVLLNLEKGPIYIGDDVLIRSPSTIDGPCFIGDGSLIEGGQVRGGCSIGKVCKISGEIEKSIFQGFCNKHHLGFMGHSYLGEWVNLGAGTTNSDLKNNYSPVRVKFGQEELETGSINVGCFIGDHSKTGIGTLIDTGAVIGAFCNIFGGRGVVPKFVPSFSWGDGETLTEHRLEKAMETASVVMRRRGKKLTERCRKIIEEVYRLTCEERAWETQL